MLKKTSYCSFTPFGNQRGQKRQQEKQKRKTRWKKVENRPLLEIKMNQIASLEMSDEKFFLEKGKATKELFRGQ